MSALLNTAPKNVCLLLVWVICVAGGLGYLGWYSANPAIGDDAPHRWPAESEIERGGGPRLLMFVHPACPCSRASLAEFSRILARVGRRCRASIAFVRPKEFAPGWERTDLWHAAAALPGVEVIVDAGGIEARRFGALNSGTTILYAPQGDRVFCGGITGARGHEGDCLGKSSILAWFDAGRATTETAPVFGCPLSDQQAP